MFMIGKKWQLRMVWRRVCTVDLLACTWRVPRAVIEALVEDRFRRKPYCLVDDWLIFHVDEYPESLEKVDV